jgi:hydroquinone glucosyltransferase
MPSLVPMEAITHIALVTIPVYSHQVSILEFAKQLIHLYKNTFHVTCIIPTISDSPSIASKHFFDTLPSNIQCIFLPSINFEDNGHVLESQVQTLVSRYMPLVRETLRSINTKSDLVAQIVDPFAYEAHQFAKELNILSYTYYPCSAMVLSMCLNLSKLDQTITCEYKDHPHPIEIPGESNYLPNPSFYAYNFLDLNMCLVSLNILNFIFCPFKYFL